MQKKRGLIAEIHRLTTVPRWGILDLLYTLFVITLTATLTYKGLRWALSSQELAPGWRYVQAANTTLSPLGTPAEPTVTPTPSPQASLRNIVEYITTKFEPEGKAVVVEAINCFYSESKLNPVARGYNRNGTVDSGIAQINSVHQITTAQAFDYRKNIDKAYEIYKDRGWSAWYGRGCGKLAYR